MKLSKTKYDPLIPWLYSIGQEELLPKYFRKTIPRSTASTWRAEGQMNLHGYQFRRNFIEPLQLMQYLQKQKDTERVLRNLAKSWLVLAEFVLPHLQKTKEIKLKFFDELQRLCEIMPRKIVLKLARMSLPKYRRHLDSLKLTCYNSPIDMCVKTHSHQISKGELIKIKKLVTAEEYACWSKSSIYYMAIRKGYLKICLSTFYKYAAMFDSPQFYSDRQERKQGAKTNAPNEKMHIDTTFWPLKNGKKAAIVFMSDNYSRAILGFNVSDQKSAQNVKGAIQHGIATIRKFHPEHRCPIELITDGGRENHNYTIDQLLQKEKRPRLHKVIAKKDVSFSNSPIEAVNKVIKRYLRFHKPDTLLSVQKVIPEIVKNYMHRPHGSLKGLTPFEGYQNYPQLDFKAKIQQGRSERFKHNRKNHCETCAYKHSKCKEETNQLCEIDV